MSIRVLLADANASVRGMYDRALTQYGFHVATAASGLECIAQIRSLAPEILVLDPELLWGQGEGVLAWIQEEPGIPPLPVILLSAGVEGDLLKRMTAFPISECHLKPLSARTLAERIHWLLRGSPLPEGPASSAALGADAEEVV